jgi:hypothetical protein
MNDENGGLDLRTATSEQIGAAIRRGIIAALRRHKQAGVPAVVWNRENNRIVRVPPEEIPDFPEPSPGADTRPEESH